MEPLSPVATRFTSLAELRAYKGERKSLMSAPLALSSSALSYIDSLELARLGDLKLPDPKIFSHNLTLHDRTGALNARRVHELLQDGLPKLPGKLPFITALVEAHEVFNELKLARFGEQATVFSLELGHYISSFNWHRDETAIIALRGPATCWLPDDNNPAAWQMMDKRSFNLWDRGIRHAGPTMDMSNEKRFLAVMI